MAATLPNPNMDFVPLDTLTADELDDLVENIEYLASYINNNVEANMMKLTVSTTDIGTGADLPANTLYAVVS